MGWDPFKMFRTGKSAADRAATNAANASARNSAAQMGLADSMFDMYQPLADQSLAGYSQGMSTIQNLLGTAGDPLQAPDMPEVVGMDPERIMERSRMSSQFAGQQFANADLNAKRRAGMSGMLSGSGNLEGALTGVDLSQAKAQSSAGLKTMNSLFDIDDANRNRQLEENEKLKYNFNLNDLLRQRQEPRDLAGMLASNLFTNPGYQAKVGALGGDTAAYQNIANTRAGMVGPGAGTQILGKAVGAWAGNWGA